MKLKLYHYWRSSCSWRVRWALFEKGLKWEPVWIDLLKKENRTPEHLARNPMGQIPVLEIQQGGRVTYLSDSTAIFEWLEENFPNNPLLPRHPIERAQTRALAMAVASGIMPLQNPVVMQSARTPEPERIEWARHWIAHGFHGIEKTLSQTAGTFSMGGQLTWGDLCLVPQIYNAYRYEVDMKPFPTIARIYETCRALPGFKETQPEKFQPASQKTR